MTEQKFSYPASCHCGEIKYTVILSADIYETPVNICDCSVCRRHGYGLTYVPRSDVVFTGGKEKLKTYQFGAKKFDHDFCANCGSSLFCDPKHRYKLALEGSPDLVGVNVRMFDDIDMKKVQETEYGTELEQKCLGTLFSSKVPDNPDEVLNLNLS